MLKFAFLFLALLGVTPVWCQVEPSATGGGFDLDDEHMMTPPPVSGDAYPVVVGSEERSNYMYGGVVFTAAYVDNLLGLSNSDSEEMYSVFPTIVFDRRTARQGESLNYSPGFNFYQHATQLNGITQSGSGEYRFHISPYAVITLGDSFQQNYNLYNQGNPFSPTGISGTPGSSNFALIAPFQNQLTNTSNARIDYQYGRNAMVGVTGSYAHLHFSDNNALTGLNDANTTEGSVFFSRRVSRAQYAGLTYQFAKNITHPINSYTQTSTVFGFYTIYLTRSFSFSILGGPERYTTWSSTASQRGAWAPAVQGSFGWQNLRTSIAASYSYIVSGAGGLTGTYKSNLVGADARFLLTRRWSLTGNASYSNFAAVQINPVPSIFGGGGRTISGGGGVEYRLSEKINTEAGYQHLHELYENVPATSFPDSNRVFFSISYGFQRPIGR